MVLKHRDTEVLRFEWLDPDGVRIISVNEIGPSLYLPWLAFPGGVTTAMKAAAMKLNGFRFKRHPNYNLSASRLQTLEEFLQNRARLIVEYGEKADRFLLIDEKNGGEPLTEFGGHEAVVLSERILQNISADPYISQDEIAQIVGVSLRRVQRLMAELQKEGRLELVGTGRVKSWKVIHGI